MKRSRARVLLSTAAWVCLLCSAAAAQPAPAPGPAPAAAPDPESAPGPRPAPDPIYREGYNYILNGEWNIAREKFEELIRSFPDSDWVDDAEFWRCYADDKTDRSPEDTFDCYENLVESYRGSQWRDDAKLAMVRLTERLKANKEVVRRYRERVKRYTVGEDGSVLLQVLVALGDIGDERSVDVILERMESTSDENLRVRIVDILEDVESPRVQEKLQELAREDPSPRVRLAALDSMGEYSSEQATALHREIARDPSQPARVRAEAIAHLADHAPADLVEVLKDLGRAPEHQVAYHAIDELGELGSAEAMAALTDLLDTIPDGWRRVSVIGEMEEFPPDMALPVLSDVARNDQDPRVRRAAVEALGELETPEARDVLIELLTTLEEQPADD